MSPRKQLRAPVFAKIACPSCGARITIDPTARSGPIQCPRCLNHIDPAAPVPPKQSAQPAPPAPPPATTEPMTDLHKRLVRLEQEREQRMALQSDLELLSSENVTLKAAIEGLQTERKTWFAPAGKPAVGTPESQAQRLAAAEATLTDVTRQLARFHDVEKRIYEIGAKYLRALDHIRELEAELRKLRGA